MVSPTRLKPALPALAIAALTLQQGALQAAPVASSSPADRVTVQAILDGPDLWIDQRRARVRDDAQAPQLLRTGASRAQLALRTSAAALRMNRSAQLRLGSRCFLIERGAFLISGPVSLCTRSMRLSVRGTHVLVDLDALGVATISVLEGQVELASADAAAAPTTTLNQGTRLQLAPDGRVLIRTALSAADYRAVVDGPLMDGFSTPLPQQPLLQRALGALAPGLSLTCAAQPEPGLADAVNRMRQRQGLPGLLPLPPETAERNCRYLAPVLRRILSSDWCDHDLSRWQALVDEHDRSTSGPSPMSELIACAAPSPLQADEVVRLWQQSPQHGVLLLDRPQANGLDCRGMTLAGRSAAICTTWRGVVAPRD